MKCLIVTAHPLKDSLCHQLAEHITGTLRQLGHEVTMEDLYAGKFDPALTPEERASYYQDRYDATKVAQQVDRLKASEILVLVFPTWWFGFPAILKGWFDRVWGPGVAYDHAKDFGPIRPRLNHLKRVLVVTSMGSPWWVDRLIMRQPVKRILKIALIGACAGKSRLDFLTLYNSEKLDGEKIAAFQHRIEKTLRRSLAG